MSTNAIHIQRLIDHLINTAVSHGLPLQTPAMTQWVFHQLHLTLTKNKIFKGSCVNAYRHDTFLADYATFWIKSQQSGFTFVIPEDVAEYFWQTYDIAHITHPTALPLSAVTQPLLAGTQEAPRFLDPMGLGDRFPKVNRTRELAYLYNLFGIRLLYRLVDLQALDGVYRWLRKRTVVYGNSILQNPSLADQVVDVAVSEVFANQPQYCPENIMVDVVVQELFSTLPVNQQRRISLRVCRGLGVVPANS